ncbi:MAG TPA: hypothetical protein VEA36_01440 [Candidatus Paceibacterota bacterium]|nr:hypothetical protein [Candidatus Paceibacterota bacterium]
MRLPQTTDPEPPPVVTAETFACGTACRLYGKPLPDPPPRIGRPFCGGCSVIPTNQPHQPCLSESVAQSNQAWIDQESARLGFPVALPIAAE